MPTCQNQENNLVLGRGRLRFDQLINNQYQGELYLGNTPELTLTQDVTTLDHFSSDFGVKEMDDQMMLQNTRSGAFTTDNISMNNIGLFFGGKIDNRLRSQATGVKEVINSGNKILRGRFYQLGVSPEEPQGLGAIVASSFQIFYAAANASISIGSGDLSTVSGLSALPGENFELDASTGELYIEADAPDLLADSKVYVQYNRYAQAQEVIIASDDQVRGALRFISDNPKGLQKNYYFPMVTLTPNGDFALKGDDWQTLPFNFGVLRRDCNTPLQVIYAPPVTDTGSGAAMSSMTASPSSIVANNTATSVIEVTVLDGNGVALQNQDIAFTISGVGGATLTAASAVTNAQGKATTSVKGTTAGNATVRAVLGSTNEQKTVNVTLTAA